MEVLWTSRARPDRALRRESNPSAPAIETDRKISLFVVRQFVLEYHLKIML